MEEIINELKNLSLKKKSNPEEFFGKLFQSRDIIHLAHLKTKSYSSHKALNHYYDELLDKIDNLIECYQGLYGLINISIPSSSVEDPIKHLESLHKYINETKSIFQDSAILNQIDEIKSLIQSTLYKLKNLA